MKQFHLLFLTLILGIWVNQTESMAQYSAGIPSENAAYIAKQEAACSQAPLIFEGYPIKTSVKQKMLSKDPYKEPFRGETRILFVVNHVYRGELANDTIELYFYSGGEEYARKEDSSPLFLHGVGVDMPFMTDSLYGKDKGYLSFDLAHPQHNYDRHVFFGRPSKQKTESGFPIVESFDKTTTTSSIVKIDHHTFGGIVNQELAAEQFNYKGNDHRWLLHKKLSTYPNIKLPAPLNKETQDLKKKPLTKKAPNRGKRPKKHRLR